MTVIFVVVTIIVFLTLDWLVRRAKGETSAEMAGVVRAVGQPRVHVRLPEGIFFARSHTWLSLFPSGKVWLGVDDFVGNLLEKPEITVLKNAGDRVSKGEPILILKEGEHHLTVRSPIEGEILSYNEELPKQPALLKEMLFTDGWVYNIKPRRFADLKHLLLGDETREWIREEFRRLRDIFAGARTAGAVEAAWLQDGGLPIAGALKDMDDEIWKRFEHEFLEIQ